MIMRMREKMRKKMIMGKRMIMRRRMRKRMVNENEIMCRIEDRSSFDLIPFIFLVLHVFLFIHDDKLESCVCVCVYLSVYQRL